MGIRQMKHPEGLDGKARVVNFGAKEIVQKDLSLNFKVSPEGQIYDLKEIHKKIENGEEGSFWMLDGNQLRIFYLGKDGHINRGHYDLKEYDILFRPKKVEYPEKEKGKVVQKKDNFSFKLSPENQVKDAEEANKRHEGGENKCFRMLGNGKLGIMDFSSKNVLRGEYDTKDYDMIFKQKKS